MYAKVVLHRLEDVSQAHRPQRQESAPVVKEENYEFERIKEEQHEYFITVGKPHIEKHQRILIKVEEDPLYVKEEGMDVPIRTVEPLRSEDKDPGEASRGAEPSSGSSLTENSQAGTLIVPPIDNNDTTSHLQIRLAKYLGPEWQVPASAAVIKEEFEHRRIKVEQPEHPQRQQRKDQLPIKREKKEELPLVKEEEDVARSTGDPLKCEDRVAEARRGVEPPHGISSTEGWQANDFIAPLSDADDVASQSHDDDDGDDDDGGHKKIQLDDKRWNCSQCGKSFAEKYDFKIHTRIHTGCSFNMLE
ncbi:uncharacterized protein LOC144065906 isoform X2 [Stigmatopora argus]